MEGGGTFGYAIVGLGDLRLPERLALQIAGRHAPIATPALVLGLFAGAGQSREGVR